jgi:imidazolonepropionase-like amidohydrolase
MRILKVVIILFCSLTLRAQAPAPVQIQSILILDAKAHLGNGKVIPRSAIGFREGKIDMVLDAFDIRMDSTTYDTIIHCKGKSIYPGFIAPNSRLGLVEISAVRASRDFDDVGLLNPHVRSLTAYNTESRITSTVRTNGVLIAQVSPKGGLISGKSSIFNLDGWNWEDAVLTADDGIHLYWPNSIRADQNDTKENVAKKKSYDKQVEKIYEFFQLAYTYQKEDFHLENNIRYESMKPVFKKKAKVFVHANRANEITDAIFFFEKFDLEIVIVGGYDAWLVAELLKDRSIPVLLERVHSLPKGTDDDIHLPFKLPSILQKAGLLVGLQNSGSMEVMGTRNLPFYAGTAVAYGLKYEEALAMITLNTAKILGIDDKVGCIEKGKEATLFVSSGDALDMRTNHVEFAFINGKMLDLDNPQKQLYRKYSKKYQD